MLPLEKLAHIINNSWFGCASRNKAHLQQRIKFMAQVLFINITPWGFVVLPLVTGSRNMCIFQEKISFLPDVLHDKATLRILSVGT